MKKLLAAVMASGLLFGGAAVAHAAGNAGPNGNNDHGLCTAYFNGQKNGHDKHGSPGPFAALEGTAADADGDGTPGEPSDVYSYCGGVEGMVGGNPAHGRYTCVLDSDPNTQGNQSTCEDNPAPGNS